MDIKIYTRPGRLTYHLRQARTGQDLTILVNGKRTHSTITEPEMRALAEQAEREGGCVELVREDTSQVPQYY